MRTQRKLTRAEKREVKDTLADAYNYMMLLFFTLEKERRDFLKLCLMRKLVKLRQLQVRTLATTDSPRKTRRTKR